MVNSSNQQASRSSRHQEISGVICLTAALFLLLCLFSYSPRDPSLGHFVAAEEPVHNLIGRFGSHLSYVLLWLFGPAVFLLPAGLLLGSALYFIRRDFQVDQRIFFSFSALMPAACGLLALLAPGFSLQNVPDQPGGLLGEGLARLLTASLGTAGAFLLLLFTLTVSLMVLFRFSLLSLGGRIKTGVASGGQTLMQLSRKGKPLLAKKEKSPRIRAEKLKKIL